jgi:hypothetical protein
MAAVSLNLDRDLEARVSRYADGVGVPLEDLIERALVFALSTRYPDNELPDGPFDPEVDNELPEGEIPEEVDPGFGVEEGEAGTKPGEPVDPARPDASLPDVNPNPNLNPDLDKDAPRPDQGLPGGGATPKY